MPRYTKYNLSEVANSEVIVEMKKPYCVYRVTCMINGKIYIGKTDFINRRVRGHVKHKIESKSLLGDAIKKYSPEKFTIEILRWFDIDTEMDACEVTTIRNQKARNKKIGYNITGGAEGTSKTENEDVAYKISRKQAITIIMDSRANGVVAVEYEISLANVSSVRSGFSWKHLDSYRKTAPDYDNNTKKFTEEQVIAIIMDPRSNADVARDFGIPPTSIPDIRRGNTWKHLDSYRDTAPVYANDKKTLTKEQAIAIIMDPRPVATVAKEYNIATVSVERIRSGKTWSSLDLHRARAPVYKKGHVKLTEDQAIAIIMDPRSSKDITKEFGVSYSMVCAIRNGSRRKELKEYRDSAPQYAK